MKAQYIVPVTECVSTEAQSIFAASGNNEDFGSKPGTYDLLKPGGLFQEKF
ncbi:MAG: hypothetical protein J5699_05585 [Bacteroidales bacterium]|nr:hypothetical protein [Bacteroidales bacterium]